MNSRVLATLMTTALAALSMALAAASIPTAVAAQSQTGNPTRTPAKNAEQDIHEVFSARKSERDRQFRKLCEGVIDMDKVVFRSQAGGLEIPAYVFQPVHKRERGGHAALVWVHGGVHGDMSPDYWPFIRSATKRGYVVLCPEYRGSTGYGRAHYDAIDYGGYEIEDCLSAVDWMRSELPHVDTNRVGVIGFSHGAFIALHSVFRDKTPFKAAVAVVPVTNLLLRLAQKGPEYAETFISQERIGGAPHEKPDVYIARSPIYHVDKLQTPLLVHVARNDRNVTFAETEMLIHALAYKKPRIAETKVYDSPEGGHHFNRLVAREDNRLPKSTPELRDSWNRIWTFLDANLRPFEDAARKSGR